MTKTELKLRKALKWELTLHAIAEIEENMELGLTVCAMGISWFMYNSGLWSWNTVMLTNEKLLRDETPTIDEVTEWEENA